MQVALVKSIRIPTTLLRKCFFPKLTVEEIEVLKLGPKHDLSVRPAQQEIIVID